MQITLSHSLVENFLIAQDKIQNSTLAYRILCGLASVYVLNCTCILLFIRYTPATVEGQSYLNVNLASFFLPQSLELGCFLHLEPFFLVLYKADSLFFRYQHKIISSRRPFLTKVSLYTFFFSPSYHISQYISLVVLTII